MLAWSQAIVLWPLPRSKPHQALWEFDCRLLLNVETLLWRTTTVYFEKPTQVLFQQNPYLLLLILGSFNSVVYQSCSLFLRCVVHFMCYQSTAYGSPLWHNSLYGELIYLLDHWEYFTSHVSFFWWVCFLSFSWKKYICNGQSLLSIVRRWRCKTAWFLHVLFWMWEQTTN